MRGPLSPRIVPGQVALLSAREYQGIKIVAVRSSCNRLEREHEVFIWPIVH